MFKKNRNMHSSFAWQRKHLFMLSREVEGELGGGVGEVEYRIPAHLSRESRIPNFRCRYIPNIVFRVSFFFFSIVNYEVITNGY